MAETINHPHDAFFKDLFSRLDVAADFFARHLPPEVASALDLTQLELVNGSFLDDELQPHFSDLVYRVRLKNRAEVYVCLLLEHKSAPDKWVAFQILRYIVRLWAEAQEKGAAKLPRVFPLVIYHGKRKWKIKPNLAHLVESGTNTAWRKYTPEFEYHLFDLSAYNEQRDVDAQALLRLGLTVLKHIFDKDLAQRLDDFWTLARGLPYEVLKDYLLTLLSYLAYAPNLKREALEQSAKTKFPEMARGFMTIAETLKREGRLEGRLEGHLEGQQAGFAASALRQLQRLVGPLDDEMQAHIRALPLTQLEQLSDDLLSFRTQENLTAWLEQHTTLKT